MTPQHTDPMHRAVLSTATLMLAALAGCASRPTALEQSLGDSVRQAVQQQSVPPSQARSPQLTDGVIAAHGVDRYEQSYLRPPAPVNVLNILAGSANAPAAAPNMPR